MWMHIPFEIGIRKKKGVSELEVDFGCFLQVEKGCFTCGSTSTDFWTTSKVAKRAAFDLSWTWYERHELKFLSWCDGCIYANLDSQYLESRVQMNLIYKYMLYILSSSDVLAAWVRPATSRVWEDGQGPDRMCDNCHGGRFPRVNLECTMRQRRIGCCGMRHMILRKKGCCFKIQLLVLK